MSQSVIEVVRQNGTEVLLTRNFSLDKTLDDATLTAQFETIPLPQRNLSLNVTLDDATLTASIGHVNLDLPPSLTFQQWLQSNRAIRCILVEVTVGVSGVDTPLYLSSTNYVTGNADTPANHAYLAQAIGGVRVTETLSLKGDGNGLSFGDIEIHNEDGALDGWLDYLWVNRSVRVYVGDPTWPRADFYQVFDGVVEDIDSKSRDKLNIKLRDKLQRLNNPVTEAKLGGTGNEKDRPLPVTLGECHNATPLLTDAPTHTYQFHNGLAEGIIEVRDNGVPIAVSPDLANGKFSLTAQPVGTITASVQGDKSGGYVNTVAGLVRLLVTSYGPAAHRFVDSEIDTANFDAFDAAHTMPVGVFLSDRANVLQVCQDLAKSIGAQVCTSRTGLLRILQLSAPDIANSTDTITAADMVERTLQIASRSTVAAAEKIGFCKNWTVQTDLKSGILEEHKSLFALEWLTETQSDSAVATAYKLDTEPTQRDTYLLARTDATAEALRMLGITKVPRTFYRFEGLDRLQLLTLGQTVTLRHARFGLSAGKAAVVTSLSPDWATGRVTVEVMV